MTRFDEATRRTLEGIGWFEGRRVDVGHLEAALWADGYGIFPVVRTFLEVFANLHLVEERNADDESYEYERFSLDAVEAAAGIDPTWVIEYAERVDASLCVVGRAHNGHLVLCKDSDGRVFGGYDDVLVSLGDTPEGALDALCSEGHIGEAP